MFSLIVASTPEGGIGFQNKLPWHISADLKHFRNTTTGHVIVMGYNTWLSINQTPLPNRVHYILTTKQIHTTDNVRVVSSISHLLDQYSQHSDKKWFIVGGANVYHQFLTTYKHLLSEIYWTIVHLNVECDQFIPIITDINLGMRTTLIKRTYQCSFYYITK